MRRLFKKHIIIVWLLTLCAILLHFYNLNWGAPFYFHPDERNIASAVSQLRFPQHMNPQFFAYGSLPIYAIYFTGYATNFVLSFLNPTPFALNPSFEQAILVSRIFSAIFATMLIPLLFSLGKKLKNEKTGLLAAFFATASTGFIQFAHFGTFEMWLTFFGVLLFWFCLLYLQKPHTPQLVGIALIFGILVAVKISSLVLLPLVLFVLGIASFQHIHNKKTGLLETLRFLKNLCLFTFIASVLFILTNPFVILATKDFLSSMHYESSVAFGTEPVFYTQNFLETTPGIYQLLHVYPFLLNPLMTVLFIMAFISLLFSIFKDKNKPSLLLVSFFLFLFISQIVLYVKWTRYMVPTMPFVYLTIALFLSQENELYKNVKRVLLTSLIIICILFSFSYFKTIFINPDSRIVALEHAQHIIPVTATILSEPSDLGLVPFQDAFPHVTTFNFYDLDAHSLDATEMQLQQSLASAQYILLPSQRILQSRMENPVKYPNGYIFYKTLLNGTSGFYKIYQTPCDIFCKITYLNDPIFWWEQTSSVFDHPTVFIFKKTTL